MPPRNFPPRRLDELRPCHQCVSIQQCLGGAEQVMSHRSITFLSVTIPSYKGKQGITSDSLRKVVGKVARVGRLGFDCRAAPLPLWAGNWQPKASAECSHELIHPNPTTCSSIYYYEEVS